MTTPDPSGTSPPADDTATEPLPAEGRRTGRGHVTSFETGRTCSTPGCDTLLSRYNGKGACALHSAQVGGNLSI